MNECNSNFLGLTLDDTLTWKQHIDLLITKMSSMSYALSKVKYTFPIETLKLIYYAHVHSIMSYGVIFGGNSQCANKFLSYERKLSELLQIQSLGNPVKKYSRIQK